MVVVGVVGSAMVSKEEYTAKWNSFAEQGFAPWDSGEPTSQLVELVATSPHWRALRDAAHPRPLRCVDIGCGSGASTRWLASQGTEALGVDLVPGLVEKARGAATTGVVGQGARTPLFAQGDIFALPPGFSYSQVAAAQGVAATPAEEDDAGAFDLVFDSQCFHVLRVHDEPAAVAAIAALLRPGGLFLVLTGNANEPEVSPAVLTREELTTAFERDRQFALVEIKESRFDATEEGAYGALPYPPPHPTSLFISPMR